MCQLLLFCNDPSDLNGFVLRVVNPMPKQGLEKILAHAIRSMKMKSVSHLDQVLSNPDVLTVLNHIDTNFQLLPKCQVPFLPNLRSGVIHKRCIEEGNFGTSSFRGIVQQLCQVLLSLRSPPSQVRTKASDGLPHDVKRPILFPEAGPHGRELEGSPWWKSLQLLYRHGNVVTLKGDSQGAVRFPWNLPVRFDIQTACYVLEASR